MKWCMGGFSERSLIVPELSFYFYSMVIAYGYAEINWAQKFGQFGFGQRTLHNGLD